MNWFVVNDNGGSKVYDNIEVDAYIQSNTGIVIDDASSTQYLFYVNQVSTNNVAIGTITGAALINFTSANHSYTTEIKHADIYTISIADGYGDGVYYQSNGSYATFFLTDTSTYTITAKTLTINTVDPSTGNPYEKNYDPYGITTSTISNWGIVSGLIQGDEANSPVTHILALW